MESRTKQTASPSVIAHYAYGAFGETYVLERAKIIMLEQLYFGGLDSSGKQLSLMFRALHLA